MVMNSTQGEVCLLWIMFVEVPHEEEEVLEWRAVILAKQGWGEPRKGSCDWTQQIDRWKRSGGMGHHVLQAQPTPR